MNIVCGNCGHIKARWDNHTNCLHYNVLLVPGCRLVLCAATGLKTYGFSLIREELTPIESGS